MDETKGMQWDVPRGVRTAALLLGAVLTSFAAGTFLGGRWTPGEMSYRQVIYVFVGLSILLVLLGGEKGFRWGVIAWVCTLGIGYRTLPVTQFLKIHPSEVLLWTLLAGLFGSRILLGRGRVAFWVPRWMWAFVPFLIWGWAPWLPSDHPWDEQFSEFRNYLLMIPLAVLLGNVLADRGNWRTILLSFYIVSACVAAGGIVEYLFPGVRDLFPAFISNPDPFGTGEGFERASFSFYGNPSCAFILLMALPLSIVLWRWWPARGARALTIVGGALLIWAIYIAGWRSLWLLTSAEVLLYMLLTKRYVVLVTIAVVAGVAYPALPAPTRDRIQSLMLVLEERPDDTSAQKRWYRAHNAIRSTFDEPLGMGWSNVGWVHSDFLQVSAGLGLLAGLFYVGAYLWTLWRLWWRLQLWRARGDPTELGIALLLSFVALGGVLLVDGVGMLTQHALPAWMMWLLVEIWLVQTVGVRKEAGGSNAAAPDHAGVPEGVDRLADARPA